MTRFLTAAILAASTALPAHAQEADADTVLATVGGTEITLGHLVAMRGRLPEQYQQLPDDVLYQGMLDQAIQQEILAQGVRDDMDRGAELGLENETRAFLAGEAVNEIAGREVDEAAVQAAYDAAYADAEAETEYNASHILVETEEEARAIKAELDGGADFAELAREKSTGPSGPNGGQLGWFGAGMMVPEFQTAVETLEPGEVSEPVQTQFGWHVIVLNETRVQEAPGLEKVRAELEAQVRQQAVEAEVARLTEEATVERAEVEVDPALVRDDALLD